MKRHLNKLIIGIVFMLVFAAGIVIKPSVAETSSVEPEPSDGEMIEIPKDYVISKSVDILVNEDNYVHTDETIVKGTLKEIVYSDDDLSKFIIESEGEEFVIFYKNLELISTEIVKTEKEDGADEVHLAFRTGEKVELVEGEDVKLYKKSSGSWSLDSMEHDKKDEDEFTGIIEDFQFLPTSDQEGEVYISHITVKNEDGEAVDLYLHNVEANRIKSSGNMTVYYIGNILTIPIFDIKESDDYALEVKTDDYEYILKKGEEVKLKQNESNDYWELTKAVNSTRYEATVEGFEFGHTDGNITSVDYINLVINADEKVQLTMLQTQAEYAIPYGNYKKIFTYDGHEKVLTDIETLDDWKMELYYDDDTMIELSVGTKVWIYKNEKDIWEIDYLYDEDEITEEDESL